MKMANYLGVDQSYITLIEKGKRNFSRNIWSRLEDLIRGDLSYRLEVPEIIEESTIETSEAFNRQVLDIIEKSE